MFGFVPTSELFFFNSFCNSFFRKKTFISTPLALHARSPRVWAGRNLVIRVRSFVRADLFAAEFAIEHQSKSWWVCRKASVHHSSVHLSPVSLVSRSRNDRGKGRPYSDELCTHRTVREIKKRASGFLWQPRNAQIATPGQRPQRGRGHSP